MLSAYAADIAPKVRELLIPGCEHMLCRLYEHDGHCIPLEFWKEKVGSALALGRQAGDFMFFLAPPAPSPDCRSHFLDSCGQQSASPTMPRYWA